MRLRLFMFAIEVLGYAAVAVGAFLIYPPAGWIVIGLALLVQAEVLPLLRPRP